MPLVSASIVAYKTPREELACAVRSALSSHIETSCTVVDNSPEPLLKDCAVDAGARYLFAGRNLGFGAGHNLALEQNLRSAPYQLVLNPDISFGPDVLPSLCDFMDCNPSIGLVMPRILYGDGSEQRLCKLLPTPFDLMIRRFLGPFGSRLFKSRLDNYEMRNLDMNVPRQVPCLSGCFMFLRSQILETAGLFDPRYFMYLEDVDLCRRVGALSKTVFYPHVAVVHGYAKGSYSSHKLLKYHALSALRYFSKWGWTGDAGARALNCRVMEYEPVVEPRDSGELRVQAGANI